jgi:hypothetical protein
MCLWPRRQGVKDRGESLKEDSSGEGGINSRGGIGKGRGIGRINRYKRNDYVLESFDGNLWLFLVGICMFIIMSIFHSHALRNYKS